ncbi:Cystathionine beta-lyase [Grifola frondosa]|uniref:Cystathionine beta-lyase n=1 Tax=Grifola frondosa TaxID=5627 RepID=A0A1C7M6K0_GRIFR|nr:Cystathionine beta-lyase [Grifola frondosa]
MTPDSSSKVPVYDLPTPDPESPSLSRPRQPYRFSTLCATVETPNSDHKDQHGSSSVPIYQTATFKGIGGQYDYTRSGNPTRTHLEHHIAKISSAAHAFTVSSGMAALDVITRLLKPGVEVIAGDDLYGGTNRLLTYLRTHMGVTVHHVDTTNATSVVPYLNPGKTAMVLLETPTNPLLKIVDIARISALVKEKCEDAVIVVDNTMMSPYLQRPLEHGADIVYDSATKYLSGHHDLMAGVITCNRDDLAKQIAFTINAVGNALTPFDSFLLLRGTKTLAIRMDRQQSTAMLVAQLLSKLGFVTHYPGLPNHPNKDVHDRISDGYGAVLSFETGDKELSERIVGATRLWGISVSFGCVNSLISMPCVMSHASIDPATRAARGLPEDLIRLCVGIEDPADLLDDLQHALLEAGAITIAANDYVRIPNPISRAVEKLALNEPTRVEKPKESREWFVSAPGKVILFGEHAVVHGVTAIAASVDLRCYGLISLRHDGKLSVHLTDISDYRHECYQVPSIAFRDASEGACSCTSIPIPIHDDDARRRKAFDPFCGTLDLTYRRWARVLCIFLRLHCYRAPAISPAHLNPGPPPSNTPALAPGDPGHVNVSHQGRRAIPPDVAEEVNRWAFTAEKVLHGNPSGVDNSVAVFGGALAYVRPGFGKKSGMDQIQGFKSLRFLLTDSKIPRDTKALVAGVARKKAMEPDVVNQLLDAIQAISDEARRALADPEIPRSSLLSALSALIDENHAHLVSLGVSHPSLEAIRAKTASTPYNLCTKLTGAGGGGCAVTLVPDDFEETVLQTLLSSLLEDNFQPYLTAVGGSGLGILSPYEDELPDDLEVSLMSPPTTPDLDHRNENKEGHPLRSRFENLNIEHLPKWAAERGKWLYV